MSESRRCLKVTVCGVVQGVCFRHYTQQQAGALGITGWVRNLPNGDVEALICGNPSQLDAMLAWLAHGPEHARVTGIHSSECPTDPPPEDFSVAY